MAVSNAVTGPEERQLIIADVSRACMFAPCEVDMYAKLCEEDNESESVRLMCGKRVKAMHGIRPAALAWQKAHTRNLIDAGFTVGQGSPRLFHHRYRDVWVLAHGDDFVGPGSSDNVQWFKQMSEGLYDTQPTVLWGQSWRSTEARVLNGLLTWHDGHGGSYEADPRQAQAIIKAFVKLKCKWSATPGVRTDKNDGEEEE